MSFWSGKKVLVTGATGLVGSWLVQELLSQRANVSCLVWDADPTSELISSKLIDKTFVINNNNSNNCIIIILLLSIDSQQY